MVNLKGLKPGDKVNVIGSRGGLTRHYSTYAFCGQFRPVPATVLSVGRVRVKIDAGGVVKSVEPRCLEAAQ